LSNLQTDWKTLTHGISAAATGLPSSRLAVNVPLVKAPWLSLDHDEFRFWFAIDFCDWEKLQFAVV
jgi:hypothetical protein